MNTPSAATTAAIARPPKKDFWLRVLTALACATPVFAAAPVGTFALEDLNPHSDRVGQAVSPRDYRQWISAYYFGNEG